MVMQLQVQIGDTSIVFFMNPPGSVENLKNYILREIPKIRFMDFVYFTKTMKENM